MQGGPEWSQERERIPRHLTLRKKQQQLQRYYQTYWAWKLIGLGEQGSDSLGGLGSFQFFRERGPLGLRERVSAANQ